MEPHPSSLLTQRWMRTPQLAEAIGVSPKALRKWMERGALDPLRLSGPQQWKLFSLTDLAAACLIPELIRIGVPTREAGRMACGRLTPAAIDFRDRGARSEPEHFVEFYRRRVLVVWRDGEDWSSALAREIAPPPEAFSFAVICAGRLVETAFARALAMSPRPHRRTPPA